MVLAPGPQVYPQQQQRSAGVPGLRVIGDAVTQIYFSVAELYFLLSPYYITQCYKLDLLTQATSGLTVISGNLSCQFKILPSCTSLEEKLSSEESHISSWAWGGTGAGKFMP